MPLLQRASCSKAVLPLLLGPTRTSMLTGADLRREVRRLRSVSRSKKLGPCKQWTTSKTLCTTSGAQWTFLVGGRLFKHAQRLAAGPSGLHCKTVERAGVLRAMQTKPQLPVDCDKPNRHDARACPASQ